VPTILGFRSAPVLIGWTPRGPADRATRVGGWDEYARIFGGLDARGIFGQCVHHFFANGASEAQIVRLEDKGDPGAALQPGTAEFEGALFEPAHGVNALDAIDFSLLNVPGETSPGALARLQEYCFARRAFLIADAPRDATFETLKTGPDASITRESARNSALYFPWVRVQMPQDDATVELPPGPCVAAIYAGTDTALGVWKAPAGVGTVPDGVVGLCATLEAPQYEALNSKGINCLREVPSYGIAVWGARTLHGSDAMGSDWKYVPVRRLALYVEQSIAAGTQWAAFEPNDERLWSQLRLSAAEFMHGLFLAGAFAGAKPDDAYSVACDASTTTSQDVAAGVVNIVVRFAPAVAGEFVVIVVQQLAGAGV
jgi:phage tail sheath protein FI